MLITADLDAALAAGPYDLVVALFGVLSHIEGKENRIDILGAIRSVLSREGLLLLTVPHALRRFPLHASPDGRGGEGSSGSARAQARRYFPSARPVIYRHHVENEAIPFPYYLFSRRELVSELSAAGLLWRSLNRTASCRSEGWSAGQRSRLSMTFFAGCSHHGPVTDCEPSAGLGLSH